MNNSLAELRRCPHCGSHARIWKKHIQTDSRPLLLTYKYEYYVMCNRCKAQVGPYSAQRTARKSWNRRVSDDIYSK